MGELRNTYQISVRKPDTQRPPGISRHRWEGNIKMDFGRNRVSVYTGVSSMSMVMNFQVQ
jgi:hypothetical protein